MNQEQLVEYIASLSTFGKLAWGSFGINTTVSVFLLRYYAQLRKEFKQAKGVFSKGKYTSNFAIADQAIIEPIIDEATGEHHHTNGKPDYLLKLDTQEDNVPVSHIFRGDFQREAMRFIERARKRAKHGEGTKPIFELMRQPGVIKKWDEIRLRTSKDRILSAMESSWTRYCSVRARQIKAFNFAAEGERVKQEHAVSVLVAEPDGKNNQIRIFDLPKWQLNADVIPTTTNSNIYVENTLADLFRESDDFHHTPPHVPHHQRYRLQSIRSVARSLMSDPEVLLRPNVVRIRTDGTNPQPEVNHS